MCGIIGIHFKDPANPGITRDNLEFLVDELLLNIEHRGKDATGLVAVPRTGDPVLLKADIPATQFVLHRAYLPGDLRTILGHTRFATQGASTVMGNNHPVQYETCFAIHNGHISNDAELFAEHSLARYAEVDSEIIPALFRKFGLDKAHLALQELEGGFATAVVDPKNFPGVTVLAKGWSSPCEVLETKTAVIWASERAAIREAAKEVLGFVPKDESIKSLTEGQILYMEGDQIDLMEFQPKAKTYRRSTVGYNWNTVTYSTVGEESCAGCGCKKLWHGKPGSYSGPCEKTVNGKKCACVEFMAVQEADVLGMEFCDGCGREFFIGDLVKVSNKYLCPNLCAKDAAFNPGMTSEQLRRRAEEVVAKHVAFSKENQVSEFDDEAWSVRMETLHEKTLELVSVQTGQAPAFVNWLIFDMRSDVMDNDGTGWLKTAYDLADETYAKVREKLDDEVSEIENQRWLSGDVNLGGSGNACDTESEEEECGVVIDIEDGRVIA